MDLELGLLPLDGAGVPRQPAGAAQRTRGLPEGGAAVQGRGSATVKGRPGFRVVADGWLSWFRVVNDGD